jgi:K+-sensing histidine kinase KdpD
LSYSGCGIAAEDLNAVFDRFYTTKKRGEGTGLGFPCRAASSCAITKERSVCEAKKGLAVRMANTLDSMRGVSWSVRHD